MYIMIANRGTVIMFKYITFNTTIIKYCEYEVHKLIKFMVLTLFLKMTRFFMNLNFIF